MYVLSIVVEQWRAVYALTLRGYRDQRADPLSIQTADDEACGSRVVVAGCQKVHI